MILQDRIVQVIQSGLSLDFIKGLDLPSFNSLFESCERIAAMNKIEIAWTTMIAAQGKIEGMKGWLKKYRDILNTAKADSSDIKEFMQNFGGGI